MSSATRSLPLQSINPQEVAVLEFLARVKHCQEHHLLRLPNLVKQSISASNAKASITRLTNGLVDKQLITKTPLLQQQSSFLALSKKGAKLFDLKAPPRVVLGTLEHDMLVVDLFLHLQHEQPTALIKTDSELKREWGVKPVGNRINVPDLLIDNQLAIEVELTLKTEARLAAIVASYMNNPSIREVHYYVRNKTILQRIQRLSCAAAKFKGFVFTDDISLAILLTPTGTNVEVAAPLRPMPEGNPAMTMEQSATKLQRLIAAGIKDWHEFWQAYR